MMRYRVTHTTRYESSEPVSVCHNQAWLTPRAARGQVCHSHRLLMTPDPSIRCFRTDAFGNTVTHFSFNEGYGTLSVRAVSRVDINDNQATAPDKSPAWNTLVQELRTRPQGANLEALEFCFDSPRIKNMADLVQYASRDFPAGRPITDAVTALTERIHTEFEYDPKATTVTTPVTEVMVRRRGVCQDFAHLQIGMLRSLGLAARYVSGYVRTQPPKGQPRLVGADASHAWLSVYCGSELGWLDVDPTNNCFAGTDHITVAWGRDYSDVTPLRGVYTGGGRHLLHVSVDVVAL